MQKSQFASLSKNFGSIKSMFMEQIKSVQDMHSQNQNLMLQTKQELLIKQSGFNQRIITTETDNKKFEMLIQELRDKTK